MSNKRQLSILLLSALACTFAQAQGREHDRGERGERGPRPESRGPAPREMPGRIVYDTRYHHDRFYPAPGFIVPGLPRSSVTIAFGGGSYFFDGGLWYRPDGLRFRVIVPPIGIVVPFLPHAYVTLRIGGLPYYYANGVYYTLAAPGPGYIVVAPPPEAVTAQPAPTPAPAPAKPDPIIYPRNGQSAEQTEADRQACNRWATTQPAAMNDASVFQRAVEACMDGRGYTMR